MTMDPHDEILGGTPAARELGRLDRIPAPDASLDREPARLADGRGPAPDVHELVAWMVGRPGRRGALGTRLARPGPDAGARGTAVPLVDRLLDRCRREVDRRGLEPGTVDLGARLDAACTPVAAQGVDLAIQLADDVPGRLHTDGDLVEDVFAMLAASTAFAGGGRHVEVQIEVDDGRSPDSAGTIVLRVDVRSPQAGEPDGDVGRGLAKLSGGAHRLADVDALATGVCGILVAVMGGALTADAGSDGEPRSRFTLPTAPL